MKTHTVKLSKDVREVVIPKLQSSYNFYASYYAYISTTQMFTYYVPRLLQHSAKGRSAAKQELTDEVNRHIVQYDAAHANEESRVLNTYTMATNIVSIILKYINNAKSPDVVEATLIHVSTHPDPRYALHISDSQHFTSCLSTGLHRELVDKYGDTPYDAVREANYLSSMYCQQTLDRTLSHCQRYSSQYKGSNSGYLYAELAAYLAGDVCYIVVGNPIHVDGVGYESRVRLHAIRCLGDSDATVRKYWLLDTLYGNREHSAILTNKALTFAGQGNLLTGYNINKDERKGDFVYRSASVYKDSVTVDGIDDDDGDYIDETLYEVNERTNSSDVVDCLVQNKQMLREIRSGTLAGYVSFIAYYNSRPSFTSSSRTLQECIPVSSGQCVYPDSTYSYPLRTLVSPIPRFLRGLFVRLISSLIGYPHHRNNRSDVAWEYQVKSPSIIFTGRLSYMSVESIRFYTVYDSIDIVRSLYFSSDLHTIKDLPSLLKWLNQYRGVPDECAYIGIRVGEVDSESTSSYSLDYIVLYSVQDILRGVLTPSKIQLRYCTLRDISIEHVSELFKVADLGQTVERIREVFRVHNMPDVSDKA